MSPDERVSPIGVGWQAHFEHEFIRDGWRMHLWRRVVGSTEVEVATGDLTVVRYADGVRAERSGIYLPGDAYAAIVQAVDPPAHGAEVRRLEESLKIERHRVDRIIEASISRAGT